MQTQAIEIVIILGYILAVGAAPIAFLRSVKYRIGPAHLEVRLLGFTVRKIRLDDIKSITTRRLFWAERWCNTVFAQNRRLVIERYSGWCKHLVISPPYRFVFRAELVEAKREYAASLADRPVLVLPRPLPFRGIYAMDWAALARKIRRAMKKGLKPSQAPESLLG